MESTDARRAPSVSSSRASRSVSSMSLRAEGLVSRITRSTASGATAPTTSSMLAATQLTLRFSSSTSGPCFLTSRVTRGKRTPSLMVVTQTSHAADRQPRSPEASALATVHFSTLPRKSSNLAITRRAIAREHLGEICAAAPMRRRAHRMVGTFQWSALDLNVSGTWARQATAASRMLFGTDATMDTSAAAAPARQRAIATKSSVASACVDDDATTWLAMIVAARSLATQYAATMSVAVRIMDALTPA
mmetsp:Transcript_4313/g.14326  ORF Transcript_4313/g.14326 Transcript_4313/m.14326 type:complete len:248 (-) Transcript_4313:5180-5923(-)